MNIEMLNDSQNIALESVKRMSKDIANSASLLSFDEARYLVDAYYMMQENRIRSHAQVRALRENEEPHAVIQYLAAQDEVLESQIQRALDKWTDSQHMGRWAKAIIGIGPVISAGLLANISIEPWKCMEHAHSPKVKPCNVRKPHESGKCGPMRLQTVGHIWSFAGLDPSKKWEKGQRRPYNASLKTLCAFKLGESFVKLQNHPKDVYGKLFAQRKAELQRQNDAGQFRDDSAAILIAKKFSKDTEAYKAYSEGRLPPAHIHARARRFAVKIFLSHYHAEAYRHQFGIEPPKPYAIDILGHAHEIKP